jgi:hypothetical protein
VEVFVTDVQADAVNDNKANEKNVTAAENAVLRGTPRQLSQQLGVSVQDVLAAIEYAQIDPVQDAEGQVEYPLKAVLSSYIAHTQERESQQNAQIQFLLRTCLDAYQDSVRQMIREENRVAYQIKDMTESRFLEVLGQVSLSLGRVEAFVMQAAKLLSQIDLRLSRSEVGFQHDGFHQVRIHGKSEQQQPPQQQQQEQQQQQQQQRQQRQRKTEEAPSGSDSAALDSATAETLRTRQSAPDVPVRSMSNSEHWKEFETELTRTLSSSGDMAETAVAEWMTSARALLNLGNLELRLNGEHFLNNLRPALMGNGFANVHFSIPSDENILPAFEKYQGWINAERARGRSAFLLFLILILNRGPQISWSGFVTTFINEI